MASKPLTQSSSLYNGQYRMVNKIGTYFNFIFSIWRYFTYLTNFNYDWVK